MEIQGDSKAVLHEKGDGFESSAVYEANGNDLTVVSKIVVYRECSLAIYTSKLTIIYSSSLQMQHALQAIVYMEPLCSDHFCSPEVS